MAQRNKGKDGNGARTQPQAGERQNLPAPAEPARPPARTAGHPLGRLRDEIDALFERFFGSFGGWPAPSEWDWASGRFWDVDVQDTDKEILVRAEAPGFDAKDFDVSVSGNTLTIRAEHKQEAEQKQGEYRSWERRYGRFERSIPLPAAIDADRVEAHYRNGVLELRLPRTEEAKRRRIEVKA
jgi:HSP20 family protein